MRSICLPIRRFRSSITQCVQRRSLLTLAIETSCDDTSVAVLEKHKDKSATLHFHSKVTSDNLSYGGIYPITAHESHQENLSKLIHEALRSLPIQRSAIAHLGNSLLIKGRQSSANVNDVSEKDTTEVRKKPDFVTVTRGPGMRASLITGIDTAKGLAVAWQIPLIGVNHMQAHALTPRLVSAIEFKEDPIDNPNPSFPFLTLLVSGGHTMLVHSKELCDHEVLASTTDMAVGDVLDKCARDILPSAVLSSAVDVMYGRLLETFAFPDEVSDYGLIEAEDLRARKGWVWAMPIPYSNTEGRGPLAHESKFSYSGTGSTVKRIMRANPTMHDEERRALARETMRVAFEHLASRVVFALQKPQVDLIDTLVVSGGVACNQYLKHVLRRTLNRNGHEGMQLVFPPLEYCTDNAAMIAWTGIEMWEEGWRTGLEATSIYKWTIDLASKDGGILGVDGWSRDLNANAKTFGT